MEDSAIVDLYFLRSETAIVETDRKYGKYCFTIADNILANREDSEESVSDTYMAAWKSIPPRRPGVLATYLGKITRRIAIDRWRARSAEKRGGGEVIFALEELEDCIPDRSNPEATLMKKEISRVVNRFLDTLPRQERTVFLLRYWYLHPIGEIAEKFGWTTSKVTSMLHRLREKLRKQLAKEGLL